MKNYLKLGLLLFAMSLYSCGGDSNNAENTASEVVNPNSNPNAVADDSGDADDDADVADDAEVPASERVNLVDKGVGPITNIDLPEDIDDALAQKGEELYNQHCTACHKPHEKFIGPAQAGALERRTPEWIMNMIINPDKMLQEDELAQDLLEEFKTPMTNQNITEDEARALLEYIRTL